MRLDFIGQTASKVRILQHGIAAARAAIADKEKTVADFARQIRMEAVLPWRAAKYLKPGAVLIRMNDMTKDSKWSRGVTGWGDGPRFLFVSLRGKCHGEKDYQFIAVRPEGHPAHRTYTMPVHWFCTEETHKALLEMGIDVTRWDATPKEGATP